jgi:pilus assembly protein FimV
MRIKNRSAGDMYGGVGKPIHMTTTQTRVETRPASSLIGPAAAAALLLIGVMAGAPANALTLGGMTIQSNLGEALRAQVQVLDLTPAESASLTVQPASAAAFQAARIEYNPALIGLQIAVERRGASQAVLRITGNRPVNEPFLEVLLEASWAGGRLSRNYTVLLDPPPAAQRTPPPAPLAPQVAPAPVPAAPPAAVLAPVAPRLTPPAPVRAPAATAAPRPPAAPRTATGQLTVRPGDTAGGIAARTKAPSVSLDQMLVAMLQSNPDAFVGGNVNRLRSGAVLNVPTEAEASTTAAPEARQIVIAQSRDFNEFRRRLASGAPAVATAAPQRQASGSVQAQVQDRRPAASTPDRLTLSKGAASAEAASAEAERVARAKQEADSAQRLAELSRNVDELNRLGTTAGSAATPTTPPPAAATLPEKPPAVVAPPPAEPVPTPKPAPAPAAPIKAALPAPPLPDAGNSFLDNSPFADPKMLGVVGLLVALVVSLVSYRVVRRRKGITTDSGFKDNKGPDSFFGASGNLHGDAANGGPSTLATSYSPSQLDAGGEVDPIAEADVYLAYGRDLQAEDILKDALRSHPERTALHAKLAEIYAKRKDVAAFNTLAGEAHRLTGGVGADWERIQALGQDVDPTNSMFRSAGAGPAAAVAFSAAAMAAVAGETLANPPQVPAGTPQVEQLPAPTPEPEPVKPMEPVMDLDFDMDEPVATPPPRPEPVETPPSLDLDFGAFTPDSAAAAPASRPAVRAEEDTEFDLDFNLDDFDMPAQSAPAAASEPLPPLDMSAFSLDLDEPETPESTESPAPPSPATPPESFDALVSEPETDLPDVAPDDALATKLALAEEFNAIGDVDGARHLIEEVISESGGSVRERARRMLADLQ